MTRTDSADTNAQSSYECLCTGCVRARELKANLHDSFDCVPPTVRWWMSAGRVWACYCGQLWRISAGETHWEKTFPKRTP